MEVHGESLGLAMRDELSGPLTLNLGVAKFEQETLSLVFSVRYPVTLKYERVYPRLSRGFTLGGFTETEMTHAAAIYMPPESELIRRLSKVYEEQTGEKAELKSIGGGTYAKSMPNLVAFGPIFPAMRCASTSRTSTWRSSACCRTRKSSRRQCTNWQSKETV